MLVAIFYLVAAQAESRGGLDLMLWLIFTASIVPAWSLYGMVHCITKIREARMIRLGTDEFAR